MPVDIGILALLIFANGCLSLAEMAVINVNINKVKLRAEQGDKRSMVIKKIKENPSNFFSTVQIGISFLSVFTGAYAGNVFAEPILRSLMPRFAWLSESYLPLIIVFTTVIISYFTLIFGELVPKRIAVAKSMEISRFVAVIIPGLALLFLPFIRILSFSADIVIKILRIKEHKEEDITEEEIRMMVDASSGSSGGIDESEIEMINNVFEFDDKTAGEIITHRKKLVAIDVNAAPEAIKNIVTERFSRIPVYEENIDNIIGILYIRDLLEYVINEKENTINNIKIREIMRKPFFVHETKRADELFKQMQKDKQHMAVVVDEYGGTIGIVTMEDLVEEIMGNIQDEFDEEEEEFEPIQITNGAYLIDGTLSIAEASDLFDTEFPDEEHDTISGFIISIIGHIPENEERPEVICADVVFKVYEMEEKRIKSIVACKVKV